MVTATGGPGVGPRRDRRRRPRRDGLRGGLPGPLCAAKLARSGRVVRLWPVDILIANAAIEHRASWQDVTEITSRAISPANFASLVAGVCRALVPAMAERGWGRVVATGSVMATRPRAGPSPMPPSKSAQLTAIRAIAREVALRGVTMNVISPGAIETEHMAARYADASFRRAVAAKIPVGRPAGRRMCRPRDLPVLGRSLLSHRRGHTGRRRLGDRRRAGSLPGRPQWPWITPFGDWVSSSSDKSCREER